MRNRVVYGIGSAIVTAAVISSAYRSANHQFFPAAVYLSHSKICLLVFANMGLVLTVAFGHFLKYIVFGELKPNEVENLSDKFYGQLIDILLALTVFRNQFDTIFFVYFTVWMFLKIFHWLSEDRVDHMQPIIGDSWGTCAKLLTLLVSLIIVDAFILRKFVHSVTESGPSLVILFCFEFIILLSVALAILVKFFFYLWDRRLDGQWHNMGVALMYLEFVTDVFQLLVYMAFFAIVIHYYGLPFHIVRNFVRKFASLRQRIGDLISYWQATSAMDERFPEASAEEIQKAEVCSICFDNLDVARTSRLPCGHILHYHCLRNLFLKKQECPLCRASVFAPARAPKESSARTSSPKQPSDTEKALREQLQLMQAQLDSMREHVEQLHGELSHMKQRDETHPVHEGGSDEGPSSTHHDSSVSEMRKRRLLRFSAPASTRT